MQWKRAHVYRVDRPMNTFDQDLCQSFFAECYRNRMFEFPQGAQVLEVGCAEADWSAPMKALRPDLHITSVDVRKCKRPASDVLLMGNVMDVRLFEPQAFDCIVSVSTIEHIGLGGYGDPEDPLGDATAMWNLRVWLKPEGWCYFDVPYRKTGYGLHGNKWRYYDDAALESRLLRGWKERARMVIEVDHPDAPYIAMTVTPA